MTKKITLLALLFTVMLSYGQKAADKTLTFENNVDDLIIVPFNGISLISEGNKIHGYNPESEEIIWSEDSPKRAGLDVAADLLQNGIVSSENLDFTVIEDTPFVQKFFDGKLYVYNSFDGKLLFAPEGKERFYQAQYLFDENAFLIRGVEDKSLIIGKYSLSENKFDWKTTVSKTYGEFLRSLNKLSGNEQSQVTDKMVYTDDKIFALIKSKFFVLDKASGNLLWKEEENKIVDFQNSLDGNKLITVQTKGWLAHKSEIELYDVETGNRVWKNPLETKKLVLFEDWQDKMLLAHYKGFNFYDYNTGEKLWKKDPKGKGIKSVIPIDSDFLYVYDDEMMLIDKNGQKLWKSDVKICDDEEDPIFFLEKTKNGRILYVTATYANMVDYRTGKKIWSGNLKLNEKRPTIAKYDETTGEFIVFNDEELYRFKEDTDEKPKPYAKLKLKNEKLITGLEIFPNNVSISGQSEVVGVDKNGKVIFHNQYVQPGELGRRLLKSAFVVGGIAGGIATTSVTVSTTYKDSNGNTIRNSSTHAAFGDKAQAIGAAGFYTGAIGQQFVQNRYNAMQETDGYALIFAKADDGGKLLIKVNKETGVEENKIILNNNKPVYDVDYATDDIYYSKGKEVRIFKS